MTEPMTPVLEVWLDDAVQRVRGKPWPVGADGQPLSMTVAEDGPWDTIVHLTSGRSVRLQSKTTTLMQDGGKVSFVALLPMSNVGSYEAAITSAEALAKELGVQDRKLYETIAGWRNVKPVTDPLGPKYMVRGALDAGVNVYFKLRHQPRENGWFVVVEIEPQATR